MQTEILGNRNAGDSNWACDVEDDVMEPVTKYRRQGVELRLEEMKLKTGWVVGTVSGLSEGG